MAIDLTPEQKEVGKQNFERVVGGLAQDEAAARKTGQTRRDFMKGLIAAGATVPVAAAAYYGYDWAKTSGKPVKAALIGAGDEGGVLVGEHNPNFLEFVAVCDIRPSNQERIFKGQPNHIRKGFERVYGKDAGKKIQVFDDYKKMLAERKDIEAVVIALPLHLHAPVAMDVMKAGKERGTPIHVLCEKLMAWNVSQCKEMIRVSEETNSILTIGHQRHYSMLYAHAVEVLKSGVLGDVKHIRALWHRNHSWPLLDEKGQVKKDPLTKQDMLRDSWRPEILKKDREALEKNIRALGYKNMEELVRWRLFNRTGGGLMAELGSHQLDACSIFLGKVHPLAVSGWGGKIFYTDEREVNDSVFVTFEFPGKDYYLDSKDPAKGIKHKDDKVIVTYSSISTNSFEPYGECVMGSRGTLVVTEEKEAMLFPERGGRSVAVAVTTSGSAPVLDVSASSGPAPKAAQAMGAASLGSGPVSRGYREEMEHFAFCIRKYQEEQSEDDRKKWLTQPRCHGRVAMADAIIALTSNLAMTHGKRIEFSHDWFNAESPEVPDKEMVPEIVS